MRTKLISILLGVILMQQPACDKPPSAPAVTATVEEGGSADEVIVRFQNNGSAEVRIEKSPFAIGITADRDQVMGIDEDKITLRSTPMVHLQVEAIGMIALKPGETQSIDFSVPEMLEAMELEQEQKAGVYRYMLKFQSKTEGQSEAIVATGEVRRP